ncbi:hypothetical protein C8Q77DRAFT_462200 [Trametes polyzona]|nr:hypothetical protein C8Q77DRAFT_462200 [Trametes polyzona]
MPPPSLLRPTSQHLDFTAAIPPSVFSERSALWGRMESANTPPAMHTKLEQRSDVHPCIVLPPSTQNFWPAIWARGWGFTEPTGWGATAETTVASESSSLVSSSSIVADSGEPAFSTNDWPGQGSTVATANEKHGISTGAATPAASLQKGANSPTPSSEDLSAFSTSSHMPVMTSADPGTESNSTSSLSATSENTLRSTASSDWMPTPETTVTETETNTTNSSHRIPTPLLVSIPIAVALVLASAIILLWLSCRRRRLRFQAATLREHPFPHPLLHLPSEEKIGDHTPYGVFPYGRGNGPLAEQTGRAGFRLSHVSAHQPTASLLGSQGTSHPLILPPEDVSSMVAEASRAPEQPEQPVDDLPQKSTRGHVAPDPGDLPPVVSLAPPSRLPSIASPASTHVMNSAAPASTPLLLPHAPESSDPTYNRGVRPRPSTGVADLDGRVLVLPWRIDERVLAMLASARLEGMEGSSETETLPAYQRVEEVCAIRNTGEGEAETGSEGSSSSSRLG